MKKIFTVTLILFAVAHIKVGAQTNTFPTSGSVGIGTLTPATSSALDIPSTTQGVLVPRMTKTQRDAIVSPVTGLLIFQTNSTPGFYYYTGAAWTPISTKGANTSLSNLAASTAINTALTPNANNTLDLGSTSLNWNELYINSIKFMDGTTQTTAGGGGGTYTGGVGINITGTVITNTGDTNSADDLTTATNFAGDATGVYNNLQLASGSVGSAEIADGTVSSTDILNNTISSTDILDGTISSTDILDGTVSSTDILNGTIAAVDLSSMGATTGQVMQYNGTSWVATTPAAGAETDPQVGVISTSLVPRWDGSALVSGGIFDDGDNISVGWSNGINANASAAFYNNESAFADETMALRAVDQTVSLGGVATEYASAVLGYNTSGLVFGEAGVSHAAVWAQIPSTGTGAALYAQNGGSTGTNYGLVAKAYGGGTFNYAIWAKASGGTNNYALIVPDAGGKSGFNWSSPSSIVGIKQNDTDDAFRVIGSDFVTDFVVTEDGKVGINSDPNALSSDLSVNGTGFFGDRVGIGISTALTSTPLTIEGSAETVTVTGTDPYIQMQNGSDNIGYVRAVDDDFLLATNAENDNGNLILRTNGSDRMYIDPSGNIVMGSPSVAPKPGYKLSVDGKVVCEELLVQLSPWPDYVFGEDYELMSLDTLSAYIEEYNRLPNIPAASEIESEGLSVGEMQKLMMEKIEELTLYMLQLKLENEELQMQLDALKN